MAEILARAEMKLSKSLYECEKGVEIGFVLSCLWLAVQWHHLWSWQVHTLPYLLYMKVRDCY